MTAADGHDWITFHRLRFAESVSSRDRTFPPIAGADCWVFGVDNGSDRTFTGASDIWGGLGIWRSREAAEAMIAAPGDAMPWLGETVAAWHCLGIPIAHRGTINWRGHLQNGDAIRLSSTDPGGPLAVMTTVGFASRGDGTTRSRIGRFIQGVFEVLDYFAEQPSNLRKDSFLPSDGKDPLTFTLWSSDEGMRQAVYRSGTHSTWMAAERAEPLSDRTSFTRFRVIRSWGDWDGNVVWPSS